MGGIVFLDRAKENSSTVGTGPIALGGATSGCVVLSGIGNGNTTYYTIEEGITFEVGKGTYNSSANTLSRDTVFTSSNSDDSKLTLVGDSTVFVTLPATIMSPLRSGADGNFDSITFGDGTSQITSPTGDIATVSGLTVTNVTNIASTGATNATAIATNVTNIASTGTTNATAIATNVTNIASTGTTNAAAIATNVTNIATNVTNIAATGATNAANITTVSGLVQTYTAGTGLTLVGTEFNTANTGNFDAITFSDAIDLITPTNTGTIKIGNAVGSGTQSGMQYIGGRQTSNGLNKNAWLYLGGGSRPLSINSYQGDLFTYQVGDRVMHTGDGAGGGSFGYICTYDDPGGGRDLDSQYWTREDYLKNPAIIKADLENKMMVIGDTDGNMDNYPSGTTVTIVPKSQVDTALVIRPPLPSSGGGTGVPDTASAGAVNYVPNLTEWYSTTGSLSAWMRSNGILYCSGVRLVGGVDQFGFPILGQGGSLRVDNVGATSSLEIKGGSNVGIHFSDSTVMDTSPTGDISIVSGMATAGGTVSNIQFNAGTGIESGSFSGSTQLSFIESDTYGSHLLFSGNPISSYSHSGYGNIISIGHGAGSGAVSDHNLFIGKDAGTGTIGSDTIFIGSSGLMSSDVGLTEGVVSIGSNTRPNSTSTIVGKVDSSLADASLRQGGAGAVAIGHNALRNSRGDYAIAIGENSASTAGTSGKYTVSIGGTTYLRGDYGVSVGGYSSALLTAVNSSYYTALGYGASAGKSGVALGYYASAPAGAYVLANGSATANIGLSGIFGSQLYINGKLGVNEVAPDATLAIASTTASENVVEIQGAVTQLGYLTVWTNSSLTTLAGIGNDGTFHSYGGDVDLHNDGRLLFNKEIRIGDYAGSTGNDTDRSIYIGNYAGSGSYEVARDNVVIGSYAGTGISSRFTTLIGNYAGRSLGTGSFSSLEGSDYSTYVGYLAGKFATGINGVGLGTSAGSNFEGRDSVHIGANAGAYGSGAWQVNLGSSAGGGADSSANYAINIGYGAGILSTGDNTIFIGKYAGKTTSGDDNIEIVTDGANPSIIGVNSNKLHIQNVLVGDTSAKKLAIGNVGASDLSPDATLEVKPNANSDVGFIVQGASSQTANLTEWQNSSENIVAQIDPSGSATFNNLTTSGNLTVSGTLTYIDSTTVTIADKQLELASNSGSAIGNDSTVDDGGIVLKSTDGDKKWTWQNATDAWHSTENIVADGSANITGLITAATGVALQRNTPATPTDKLYNVGGVLYFNGSGVNGAGGGGGTTYTAGTGLALVGTEFNTTGTGYFDYLGIGTASPTYLLDVAGNAGFDDYLYHNGDADTYIRFQTNSVNLVAGGKSALKLDYSTGKIQLNNTNADLDVQIMADDGEVIFHTDAGTNRVGIGTGTPGHTLEVAGTGSFNTVRWADGTTQVTSATGDISVVSGLTVTNVTNIAATGTTNAAAIIANTSNISTNVTNIAATGATNAAAITTNTTNIAATGATNAAAILASTYTAGTGLTLVGTEFNTANTGNFDQVTFTDNIIRIGDQAGDDNSADSSHLIAIGYQAGDTIGANSDYTTAIGYQAGTTASGDKNVMIGYQAGSTSTGNRNVFIGDQAGELQDGERNIFIGQYAGHRSVGDDNVYIGTSEAGQGYSGSNNIEIMTDDSSITSPLDNQSNKINIELTIIGDTSARKLAIGNCGDAQVSPDATLEILPKEHTDIGLIVQGDTSHSANLTEWQNSSETILASVAADGAISASGAITAATGVALQRNTPATTTDKLYNVGGALYFNGSAVDGDTTYTAGSGLQLNGTTFDALTATTSVSGITQLQDSATDGTTDKAITPNAVYDISGVLAADVASTGTTNAAAAATNATNIATNVTNIAATGATNAAAAATNATNIATNVTNIAATGATNAAAIATNVTNIATNATNIASTGATNAAAIVTNTTNIASTGATNAAAIATNVTNIATNVTNIAATGATNAAAILASTYTAGTGLTLVGTEFNTADTGNFDQVTFTDNIRVGNQAGDDCPATSNNLIAIGYQAADSLKEESDKIVAIGYQAGYQASGDNAVFIGSIAGYQCTNPEGNVAIGNSAMQAAEGKWNVSVGRDAGRETTNQDYSVNLGYHAGYSAVDIQYSVAIGFDAARDTAGINKSVLIGYQAGEGCHADNSIFIGYQAGKSCVGNYNIELVTNGATTSILDDLSNKINIDSTIVGDTSAKKLAIGNVGVGDVVPDATLEIKPNATTDVGLIVQGASSHTANLTEWQNSSETVLAYVDKDGSLSGNAMTLAGHLAANTKSFLIDHPTKEGKQLQYASLEGPEHGVYVRGYTDVNTISLPDYWIELVRKDSLTVHLTPKDFAQPNLFVSGIIDNTIYLNSDDPISTYYTVNGTRKDVDLLEVEI